MTRLLLVRHAPTAATRAGAFPLDEPLDDDGRAAAASLAGALPGDASAVCSPARRCLQTAAALGLLPKVDAGLRECDFGRWAGRTLAEVDAEDPAATRAWMLDPAAAPHHGESLLELHARVGAWLADLAAGPSAVTVAVTHGGVMRSAVTHALNAPLDVIWRIAVPPLSITALVLGDDGLVTLLEPTRPMVASLASPPACECPRPDRQQQRRADGPRHPIERRDTAP